MTEKPLSEIERTFYFDDGHEIKAHRTDPYGFWKLKAEKGTLPDVFKTAVFTTFHEAKKAVIAHTQTEGIRKLIKVDIGSITAYEQGLGKRDEYNPPELKTKTKHRVVQVD